MKISLNWLKDFVDIDITTERLAEVLVSAGLEVEGIDMLGEGLDNVVVARILAMKPHPNADRLTLCSVTTGDKTHAIVCGAKNMKEGDYVALALPGAHLPNGVKITKSKLRGEVSEGMLCSETELGLAKESSGLIILNQYVDMLDEETRAAKLGQPIASFLLLQDTVLDIGITPNRPDCLSVIGIAREAAALTGKVLKKEGAGPLKGGFDISSIASAGISDSAACLRYTARVIKGIKVGPSPLWLRRRLDASGMRSINNVVDITNYVMLESGQPLHAFDLNLLEGKGVVVRLPAEGEKITTLDGIERVLDKETLIIADKKRPVAVAGVMGGMGSEVSESTVDILLESAYFKPSVVRRSSKKLGLRSESSHRFERGVDPNGVLEASDRAVGLILDFAGGEASSSAIDIYPAKINPLNIEMRVGKAKSVLGIDLDADAVSEGFKMLGFAVEKLDSDRLKVTPPTFRVDLTREIDLIEEVARLNGYDSIPVTYPRVDAKAGEKNKKGIIEDRVRGHLTGAGFYEAVTYSFVSEKAISQFLPKDAEPVRLLNPLSEDQSVMRTSIIPSLLEAVGRNLSHQNENLRFFEIGRVFPLAGHESTEKVMLTGVMAGLRYGKTWNLPGDEIDFFDVKGVVENILECLGVTPAFAADESVSYLHPGKSASVRINGLDAGVVGELHPDVTASFDIKGRVYAFEIDLKPLMEAARSIIYAHIPKFPAVLRDVAIVLDSDVPAERVYKAIKGADELVSDVSLFDLYQGKHIPEGRKSMAYSIRYQASDRTLKEEEVNLAHERVLEAIKKDVGGALRE